MKCEGVPGESQYRYHNYVLYLNSYIATVTATATCVYIKYKASGDICDLIIGFVLLKVYAECEARSLIILKHKRSGKSKYIHQTNCIFGIYIVQSICNHYYVKIIILPVNLYL